MAKLTRLPSPRIATLLRRGPWLALTLTVAAVGVGSQRGFELDPGRVLLGEWWRLLSCHLVHYSPAHAVGDIAAFTVWAAIVEAISRRLLVWVLGTAALVVGLGVLVFCPAVRHYGGLSAIDVALATALLGVLATSPEFRRLPGARTWVALIALAHVSKAFYELALGTAILAPDLGKGVVLLPPAHLLGAAAGLLGWLGAGGASAALESADVPSAERGPS